MKTESENTTIFRIRYTRKREKIKFCDVKLIRSFIFTLSV